MHVGKGLAAMLVIKRLAGVAPEEDLRECIYITFTSAKQANKAEPTRALKPRGDVTRNPKQGYPVAPK